MIFVYKTNRGNFIFIINFGSIYFKRRLSIYATVYKKFYYDKHGMLQSEYRYFDTITIIMNHTSNTLIFWMRNYMKLYLSMLLDMTFDGMVKYLYLDIYKEWGWICCFIDDEDNKLLVIYLEKWICFHYISSIYIYNIGFVII